MTQPAETAAEDDADERMAIVLGLVAGRVRDGQLAALESALRFAFGVGSDADASVVREALRACLLGESEESLERALGMHATLKQRQLAQRDLWYRRALAIVAAQQSGRTPAVELEAAWTRFVSRGAWTRWRGLQAPPVDAEPLDIALFWATRFNGGDTLSARHGYRIVGDGRTWLSSADQSAECAET